MSENLNKEFENYFRVKNPDALPKIKKVAEAEGISYLDAYCSIAPKFKDRDKLEKKLLEMSAEGNTLDGGMPRTNQPPVPDTFARKERQLNSAEIRMGEEPTIRPKDDLLGNLVDLDDAKRKMNSPTKSLDYENQPEDTAEPKKPDPLGSGLNESKPADAIKCELPKYKSEEKYTKIKKLGEGGMGIVLNVKDNDIGRNVALKQMKGNPSPDQIARFIGEGEITGQLEHPNIVPVHELVNNPIQNEYYFTMKLVQGEDLEKIVNKKNGSRIQQLQDKKRELKEKKKWDDQLEEQFQEKTKEEKKEQSRCLRQYDLNSLLRIFTYICNGMAFAHSKDVIHRDLKTANVMVGRFGEVQIMDWGLAKIIGTPEEQDNTGKSMISTKNTGNTLEGTVMGTPAFMPPEQAEGKLSELDSRSDVYSLGAVLYHITALKTPITGESVNEILIKCVNSDINPLPRTVPKELQSIIYKAMAYDKKDRYQSAEEFGEDVQRFLEGKQVNAHNYSIIDKISRFVKTKANYIVGIGIVALASTTGIGVAINANAQKIQAEAEKAKAEARANTEEAEKIKAREKATIAEKEKAEAEAKAAQATAAKKTAEATTLEAKAEAADLARKNAEIVANQARDELVAVEAARKKRDESNKWIQHGFSFYGRKNYVQAKIYFDKAVEEDPTFAEAYIKRAVVLTEIAKNTNTTNLNNDSNLKQALEDALKALELDKKNTIFRMEYAYILELLGNIEQAEKEYILSIEIPKRNKEDPHPYVILNLAAHYSRRRMLDQSIERYIEYLEKVPSDGTAYAALANEYSRNKNYELTEKNARLAIENGFAGGHYELALAEYYTGRYKEAEEHFKIARANRPDRLEKIDFALAELEKLKKK